MEAPKRRLSAVWFADIVGYSTLSERDEPAALRLVNALQTLSREIVPLFEGRIVKFIGDAVLSEFASSDSALRAAVTLQERYVASSSELGLDSRLRVGVHVGEVNATPDGDLYGDGINTAARLHQKAEPGQVIVSEDVWRLLRQRPEFRFEPLGDVELKGITTRVGIYDVLFGARAALQATGAAAGPRSAPGTKRRKTAASLAVAIVVVLAGAAAVVTFMKNRTPGTVPSSSPAQPGTAARPPSAAADTPPAASAAAAPRVKTAPPPAAPLRQRRGETPRAPDGGRGGESAPAVPAPGAVSAPTPQPALSPQPAPPQEPQPPAAVEPGAAVLDGRDMTAIRALLERLAAALASENPQQSLSSLGRGATMVVTRGWSQMKATFGEELSLRVGMLEPKEIRGETITIRFVLIAKGNLRGDMPLTFSATVRRGGDGMQFDELWRDFSGERGGRGRRGGRTAM